MTRRRADESVVKFGATYEGLRVLDLSTNLAGPLAAMVLGDMGADVVKVERKPNGDDTRVLPPHHGDDSTVFLAVNRNKRSLLLDFKSELGRTALLRLAGEAHVVVESFPPGIAESLKLTYADFRAANPGLIVCSISAFGDGPIGSKAPGYDALVQAASGMMSFTGAPGSDPVRIAPSILDLSTGLWAVVGIMAALARVKSGAGGEHVRPSLLDSAFTMMCHQVLGFLATGKEPEKLGSGAPSAAPYRVFEASDGPVMIATASDRQFERLCEALSLKQFASDSRFSTMEARLESREELDAIIAAEILKRPVGHWLQKLSAAGISVGPVNNLSAALDAPVAKERSLFVNPETVGWPGGMPLLRLPVDPDGSSVRRRPPRLGEHSEEILREAGFSADELRKLLSS